MLKADMPAQVAVVLACTGQSERAEILVIWLACKLWN